MKIGKKLTQKLNWTNYRSAFFNKQNFKFLRTGYNGIIGEFDVMALKYNQEVKALNNTKKIISC